MDVVQVDLHSHWVLQTDRQTDSFVSSLHGVDQGSQPRVYVYLCGFIVLEGVAAVAAATGDVAAQ